MADKYMPKGAHMTPEEKLVAAIGPSCSGCGELTDNTPFCTACGTPNEHFLHGALEAELKRKMGDLLADCANGHISLMQDAQEYPEVFEGEPYCMMCGEKVFSGGKRAKKRAVH